MREGLLAEFGSARDVLAAAAQLRAHGYRRLDAFTPYPVHGLDEALGIPPSRLSRWVLLAGLAGATGAYLLQWYLNAWNYPINVGGRPPHAFPAFLLITFEMGVLAAGFACWIALAAYARLPKLWDPVFEVEGFERASVDRFWIGIALDDPHLDRDRSPGELTALGALRVAWTGGGTP